MGGLSCVAGKKEVEEESVEAAKPSAEVERQESQKPWNRHSLQIYCGEPRKTSESCEEKPPDDTLGTKDTVKTGDDIEVNTKNVAKAKTEHSKDMHNISSSEDILDRMVDLSDTENESKDSVPDIRFENVLQHSRFYPPPHIAPFDPSIQVKKRPRSLDSAQETARKPRPLSYSPGFLKTRHPRSLHCIAESVNNVSKKRPVSMDMSAFFEVKGFDIHTQKLRRVLTQKVKEKIKEDWQNNKAIQVVVLSLFCNIFI